MPNIDWKYETESYRLGVGYGRDSEMDADILFTQPYDDGVISKWCAGKKPMIVMDTPNKSLAGTVPELVDVGKMYPNTSDHKGQHLWTFGCSLDIDLSAFKCDTPCFWPLSFCLAVLEQCAKPGQTVLDPCMGRGTAGRAALLLGMRFIGIDKKAERVKMARRYIDAGR